MFNNLKISFFLAYKSITRGNKGTLSLTVLIMTLAFVNLIFISSIFLGIIKAMNEGAIKNEIANIIIEPEEDEDYIEQARLIQTLINSTPGVIGSSAHYTIGAIFSYDENKDGNGIKNGTWQIKSLNIEDEKRITDVHKAMVAGEYLEESDRDKIILGKEISGGYGGFDEDKSLGGVKVNDEIKVSFSNGIQRKYKVKGIFNTRWVDSDMTAFITKKEMESVLSMQNRATEIIVKIDQVGDEERYIREFRNIGIVKEEISPWSEKMGAMANISESFNIISLILGIIGAVVAGITIFIVIYVSVISRRRQIGILKAIGMSEQTIIVSYILQALFYAILGIVLGLIFIFLILVPYFIKNPLDFPIGWISLSVTQSNLIISSTCLIVAAIIGGFIPSRHGAKESILDAIWGS